MKRGEIYRVTKPPGNDPKQYRFFVVVSTLPATKLQALNRALLIALDLDADL